MEQKWNKYFLLQSFTLDNEMIARPFHGHDINE